MTRFLNCRARNIVVLALDVMVATTGLFAAAWLRAGTTQIPGAMNAALWTIVPTIACLAIGTHLALRMHRMPWRYTSLHDLKAIVKLGLVLSIAVALLLGFRDLGDWRPRSLPIIYFMLVLQGFAALRLLRRMVSEFMQGTLFPPKAGEGAGTSSDLTLFAGKGSRVELMLRANERHQISAGRAIGILLDDALSPRMTMRGVPVLGTLPDLEAVVQKLDAAGNRPTRLVFAETPERLREAPFIQLVVKAESLGIAVSCLPEVADYLRGAPNHANDSEAKANGTQALRPIQLSELLGRPQNVLDCQIVKESISGRRVLVTGAGGTIGRELARQIASFGPSQLILLESSEIALYDVDNEIKGTFPEIERSAIMCCIRQRGQLMNVFKQFRPELVFHAAALKHVPIVELHPSAGVQTNVIGTRNVADAALRYGAMAMVQVSTDKAVNPVGLMGATKRLGELYCQALDLAGQGKKDSPRFLTVRFGNVLGSSGSLIPLFEKQLAAGGPLTVTHPEITRFFMTVSEAVQLVLQASARSAAVERGRIFVLDMGEPIKILDVARRMIRLSGKVPDKDVAIKFVGLRPGEKLYEELFNEKEQQLPSVLEGIFEAEPSPLPLYVLNDTFDRLSVLADHADDWAVKNLVFRLLNEGEEVLKPHSGTVPVPEVADFSARRAKVTMASHNLPPRFPSLLQPREAQ